LVVGGWEFVAILLLPGPVDGVARWAQKPRSRGFKSLPRNQHNRPHEGLRGRQRESERCACELSQGPSRQGRRRGEWNQPMSVSARGSCHREKSRAPGLFPVSMAMT
jgi:hypothetical protein